MVIFIRFRPLTPNQKEQQPVLTSKPKTGSASASRSSKKSLKEDGEQFSTLNFACCGGLRLPFVCLIFDCSKKKTFLFLVFPFIRSCVKSSSGVITVLAFLLLRVNPGGFVLSCITELFWGLCTGYYDLARETGSKAMHPKQSHIAIRHVTVPVFCSFS